MGINIFALIIGAIFVNNVVLAQFLGICPFLGVSKDVKSSLGMGGAVLFVMMLATLVTYLIYYYILIPLKLDYLQTIAYILVIAGLVSDAGRVSAADYHQLRGVGCGHTGNTEKHEPA